MFKKKTLTILISLCLGIGITTIKTHAEDFNGQEEKYIKLCSSSKLTDKQQKTCQEFNTYLNDKTKQMKEESKEMKQDLQATQKSIDDITQQMSEYDDKISSANAELQYIKESIQTLNKNITTKKEQLEDRLYAMQTTYNSNMYINYIFSSQSISDFIGRLINFKEITSYDNELIEELKVNLAEVEKQQSTLSLLKESLKNDKKTQLALQQQFIDKLTAQKQSLADQNSEILENQESAQSIAANLAAIKKASEESKVNNVTQAVPNKKPSTPVTQPESKPEETKPEETKPEETKPDTTPESKPETGEDNKPTQPEEVVPPEQTQPDNSNELTSSEELGLKIANKALTRLGCTYVWGAAHSWTSIKNPDQTQFDCSGLVNWAHYQSGVDLGRIHYTGSMINAGKSVSKSELQAGDIILFSNNGAASGVHHVGIYIGDNKMVHAPTEGMPVQVANLNTNYWQKEWYCCRRLY